MSESLWLEFITIAGVHLIAVASPGPDFAIVLKQVINQGRRAAIFSSVGIGLGIMLHVVYSILGLSLLIKTTPMLYNIMLYAAAGYLFYIGLLALRSQPSESAVIALNDNGLASRSGSKSEQSIWQAFRLGFVTNGLNPKATLFFLSLFSVVVAPTTNDAVRWGYGVYLAVATGIWFVTLSILLSNSHIDQYLQRYRHVIDRLMGVVLIVLAISLVLF
ncbi:LysE family transporter [Glaciecola sp.]|jgi:RhtB (resistance to homoserine/threonine) family protein|nr:LysE family transporter [Glaciecola sp.]